MTLREAERPGSAIAPPEAGLSERGKENLVVKPLTDAIQAVFGNQYHRETNPNGVVSLGVAENSLMAEELTEFMNAKFRLTPYDLTYGDGPLGSKRLRKNLADFFNVRFNPQRPVDQSEVLCASGVTVLVDQLAWILGDPGDGILIGQPLYSGFFADLEAKSRVKCVKVSLAGVDPFSKEAVHRYDEAFVKSEDEGVKIKGILICNPHNPLGKCYPIETIKEFMKIAQKHQIHLVSDEVYALNCRGLIDKNLVHVLYGMSKDFSSNGLRVAAMVTRNCMVSRALGSLGPFGWPSTAADILWNTVLEDKQFLDWYIAENQRRLGKHYKMLTDFLDEHKIEYVKGGSTGFFVWCDLRFAMPSEGTGMSAQDRERILTRRMIDAGVYLATGDAFASEEPGWYRITFSQPENVLMLGLQRLLAVLKRRPTFVVANGNPPNSFNLAQPLTSVNAQFHVQT